jgi:hypothetical protein
MGEERADWQKNADLRSPFIRVFLEITVPDISGSEE